MTVTVEGPVAVLPMVDDVDVDGPVADVHEPESEEQILEKESNSLQSAFRKPFSPEDTIIVFDWDDTLLPSSFITQEGLRLDGPLNLDEETLDQMAQLAECVKALLRVASECGTVVIITNAETGWVELSCAKFLPSLVDTISRLDVVSARSTYEPSFPDSPLDWKFAAFSEEISRFYGAKPASCVKNVLSFGDSIHERDAVHLVTGTMDNVRTKSIKFVERPSIEQLRRQVELVQGCFAQLCSYDADLDLMLTIHVLQNQ